MKSVADVMAVIATCLVLASCGGGSSTNNTPPGPTGTTAPSALGYSTPQTLKINQSVTPINPTVTGSVTSYSVSPALPVGLTLNSTTGVITGTPTAVTAQANYTVTATNSGGSATATLAISVSDVAPAVKYTSARMALAVGLSTTTLAPASTGGTVTSWAISPALPAGLTFNTTDGTITGTPTATAAAQVYTVTATNSGGNTTFALNLSVETGTVLDVGHNAGVATTRFDGTHVLTLDHHGHWVLWNYATAANLANGATGCFESNNCYGLVSADMAGSTIALQTPTNFEMRSTTDGHLLGTVAITISGSSPNNWWALASDGSYLVAGGSQGLRAWSPTGQALFATVQGDYRQAVVSAAPGQIRLTGGPASGHAIETIDAATGTSTVGASYNGTFLSWFADGNRFLSISSGTVLTYSKDVVQQDATAIADQGLLSGTGNWFWNNHSGYLDIYEVGASGTPALHMLDGSAPVVTSGSTLALFTSGQETVIDLSGVTPVASNFTLPSGTVEPAAYAATDAAHWVVGNNQGLVIDDTSGTPRLFDYGIISSVAGSSSRFSVAVASGQVLLFDSTSLAQVDSIAKNARKTQFSADGSVFGVSADTGLFIYQLPAKTLLHQWPGAFDFTLSDTGTVLGQSFFTTDPIVHEVSNVDGSTVVWTDQSIMGPVQLAPGGNPIAISKSLPPPFAPLNPIPGTSVVSNGALVTAFDGYPVGWLDDNRLLLNNYMFVNHQGAVFGGMSIVSPSGVKLADAPLPELAGFQLLGADSIYSAELNEIVSPTTGVVSWRTGDDASAKLGAVAGSHVVFVSGTRVLALSQ